MGAFRCMSEVRIIGAGLAGSEAAWQCARRGIPVELVEMRPVRSTPAHQTADFAELVCSNSLKSDSENTAPWLLKEEMRRAGSLLIATARECSVPAGHALAVDRLEFSRRVTEAIFREPLIAVRREEVTHIEESEVTVIATGPLTSDALSAEIQRLSSTSPSEGDSAPDSSRAGAPAPHNLYFYDSISPIVEADSIDMSQVYLAARYGKGSADYINCPMSKDEYDAFYDALVAAQPVEEKDMGEAELLRGLSAHRRNCPARTRYPALRADETGRAYRSAHRENALCRRATAAGKSAGRFLQSRWIPESLEIRQSKRRCCA